MISPKPLSPKYDAAPQLTGKLFVLDKNHPAYRHRRKSMTIGVGFTYDGGLLLCADTKVSGAIKENQSKIDVRTSNNGYCRIAFAMSAVDLNFPKSAVDKCWAHVQQKVDFAVASMDAVVEEVERSLASFYETYIYPHPDRQPNSPYLQFLVGIWLRDETRLYVSYETLFRRVEEYECIGSAAYLAKFLIRRYLKANGERWDSTDAELMAEFAVGSAIEYDEACGGTPEILKITNDGTVTGPAPPGDISFKFVDGIANYIWQFHRNFIHSGDDRWSQKALDSELKELTEKIRKHHTSVWFNW